MATKPGFWRDAIFQMLKSSRKSRLIFTASDGGRPATSLTRSPRIPLMSMESLSACRNITPFWMAMSNQTLDWQPFTLLCSVLRLASISGSSSPSLNRYKYLLSTPSNCLKFLDNLFFQRADRKDRQIVHFINGAMIVVSTQACLGRQVEDKG